jgi:hypothetical protein
MALELFKPFIYARLDAKGLFRHGEGKPRSWSRKKNVRKSGISWMR